MSNETSFGQLGKDIISLVDAENWAETDVLHGKATQGLVLMGEHLEKHQHSWHVRRRFNECTWRCGNLLALVLTDKGRWQQAEILLTGLWHLAQLTLPEGNRDVLQSIKNLTKVLERHENFKEAEKMHRMAVDICVRCFKKDHTYTLNGRNNLAIFLKKQCRWQEAEQMHREVLEVRRRVLGENHEDTQRSRNNLASVLREQGKWQEVEDMHRELLEVRRRDLGEEHPDILSISQNLAAVLQEQGKWQEAEEMLGEVAEVRRRVLGHDHRDTLSSRSSLASVLQEQGKCEEAEEIRREVMEVRRQNAFAAKWLGQWEAKNAQVMIN